jgi:hypothetical protein
MLAKGPRAAVSGWIADSWTMRIPVLRELANRSTITLRGYQEI